MKLKRNLLLIAIMAASTLFSGSCTKQDQKKEQDLNVDYINTDVDPGDNFYNFVNDGWMEAYPIPADESRFGSFDLLRKKTKEKVKGILEECKNSDSDNGTIEQKIGDFYELGMDTGKIEKQGLKPLEKELAKIKSIQSKEDIQKQFMHFHNYNIGSFFGIGASADAKNSDMNIAQLSQGGLGMSDRDYYVKDDKRSKEIRDAYRKYVSRIFQLAGDSEQKAKNQVKTIMNIETRLAEASMTRLERRNPKKTYNKMTLEEVQNKYSNIKWENYFKGLDIEVPSEINVRQPGFFSEANKMMEEVSVEDWKTYFRWNLLNSSADYLTDDFVQAHFDFYGKEMQGKKEMKERWRKVLDVTNFALGQAVGKKFVEKHFPPEAKKRMVKLVENLKSAFANRIENLEWMSGKTKEKALEKLEVMNKKIGYPDEWRDYSDLSVGQESYFDNVMAARKFQKQYQLDKIGKPVNENEWFFPPQTVNAYYAPSMNEVCFPAGILQPPFFYLEGDDAVNYGAIGAVIGHEMTHGFDDQGRQYDKKGNLHDWWTKEDSKNFEKRTKVLVKQYDQKTVLDTVHADGELTLGENIADLGGLSIAYTAFKMATSDKELPEKIDGYTPKQRFFLAWGRVWAQNIRDKEILRRTKEDVHSLGVHRVNGPIANIDAWYEAFNVSKDDSLYIPQEKRAKIW
jgi:putative endopeptidase